MKRNQARREKQKRAKKVRVYDVDFFVPQVSRIGVSDCHILHLRKYIQLGSQQTLVSIIWSSPSLWLR